VERKRASLGDRAELGQRTRSPLSSNPRSQKLEFSPEKGLVRFAIFAKLGWGLFLASEPSPKFATCRGSDESILK
jgi:hypothetical protein